MLHKKLFTTLLFSTLLAASQTSATAPTPGLAAKQTITTSTYQQGQEKASARTLANWAVRLVVHALGAIALGTYLGSIATGLLILCSFYGYEGINTLFSAKKTPESGAVEKQDLGSLRAIIQLGLRFVVHLACHLALFSLAWYVEHRKRLKSIPAGETYSAYFKKEKGFQVLAFGFGFFLVLYGVDIVRKAMDRWIREGENGKPSSLVQFFKEAITKFLGHLLVAVVAGAICYGVDYSVEEDDHQKPKKYEALIAAVHILLSTYLYYGLGWVVDKLFALGKKGAAPSTYIAESEELAPSAA